MRLHLRVDALCEDIAKCSEAIRASCAFSTSSGWHTDLAPKLARIICLYWAVERGKYGEEETYARTGIKKLRETEVAIAAGGTVAETARRIGVAEQTFYRWRGECGGLRIDEYSRERLAIQAASSIRSADVIEACPAIFVRTTGRPEP